MCLKNCKAQSVHFVQLKMIFICHLSFVLELNFVCGYFEANQIIWVWKTLLVLLKMYKSEADLELLIFPHDV